MGQRYNNVQNGTANVAMNSTLFDFESDSNEMRNHQLLQQALNSCASSITPTLDQEQPEAVAIEMYRPRSGIYGPLELPPSSPNQTTNYINDDEDELNSSMDTTHLLKLLTSLGQSSSAPSSAQDKTRVDNDLLSHYNYNYNNNNAPPPPAADSTNNDNYYFEPSPLDNDINSALLSGSSTAIVTKRRRLSLLATTTEATTSVTYDTPLTTTQTQQSHSRRGSRRLSLGISVEDIETILNIDTTNASSRCNSRRSSLSYSIQKPSCESLSRFTKTLSMHLLELCNISSSSPYCSTPIHQDKSNASFNQCKASGSNSNSSSSSMNDANVLLMNLFNTSTNKKNQSDLDNTLLTNNRRNFVLTPDDSAVPSSAIPSSNIHWRESSSSTSSSKTLIQENLFTSGYESSSFSTFKQRQHLPTTHPHPETASHGPQTSKINPLDEKSPFYSESFANVYKDSLQTLVRKMAQSSQSRKGFEEVKRQLNSCKMKQMEQQQMQQQNDPFCSFSHALQQRQQQQQQGKNCNSNWNNTTSSAYPNRLHLDANYQNTYSNNNGNHTLSYAAIKATRRRSSKKVEKKKQHNKYTHRRSLSLKGGCTPEMIFGY